MNLDLLFWGLGTVLITTISFFLARNSMKDYEEFPSNKEQYGLYLIRSLDNLTVQTLQRFYQLSLQNKLPVTFERLFKGREQAVTVYLPVRFKESFPELNLLELEDYIDNTNAPNSFGKKVTLDDVYIFLMESKDRRSPVEINPSFLNSPGLSDSQKLSIQSVLFAEKSRPNTFQTTLRVMVADKAAAERVALTKRVQDLMLRNTSLIRKDSRKALGVLFESFKKRTFIPKEISPHYFSVEELIRLVK